MNYIEYGKDNEKVIVLLHGGGLSWWNYKAVAELLKSQYRVILPILDGHANSDQSFTTIHSNASEIISFIDQNFDGKVFLMGGLSLGAQVLLEILSLRFDICQYAIIESALVIPSNLTNALVKPSLDCSYGLIQQEWFAKLQFKYLRIHSSLFDDYFKDTKAITKQNMIAFLKENATYQLKDTINNTNSKVSIFVGTKENKQMIKSAHLIHHAIKHGQLYLLKNMLHGEFSMNYPELYVSYIKEIVEGE